MKKEFFLFILVAIMAACSETPKDRAKKLIDDVLKKSLFKPESYEAVDTQIDSAFTPFGDISFYEQTLKFYKLSDELQHLDIRAKNSKKKMAENSGPYLTSYSRHLYNEAKEDYDEVMAKKEKLEPRVSKMAEDLKAQIKAERQFVGYWAIHRYRAKTVIGETVMSDVVFVFDKDMSQILHVFDTNDNDFKKAMLLYMLMRGKDIELEEDKWMIDEDLWDSVWNKE